METLGEYLRRERERKKVSLVDVARVTRVKIGFFIALENDDYSSFPAPVFTRGFISSYARHLGLDPNDVLRRYEAKAHPRPEEPEAQPSRPKEPRDRVLLMMILGLVATSAIVLSTISAVHRSRETGGLPTQVVPVAQLPEKVKAIEPIVPQAVHEEKVSGHKLLIEANEQTWFRIQLDDGPSRQMSLFPGERAEFFAKEVFKLRVGNAGGILLTLDGSPLGPLGPKGAVTNVILPQESTPLQDQEKPFNRD